MPRRLQVRRRVGVILYMIQIHIKVSLTLSIHICPPGLILICFTIDDSARYIILNTGIVQISHYLYEHYTSLFNVLVDENIDLNYSYTFSAMSIIQTSAELIVLLPYKAKLQLNILDSY